MHLLVGHKLLCVAVLTFLDRLCIVETREKLKPVCLTETHPHWNVEQRRGQL